MTKRNGNSSDDGNRLASDSSSTRLYEEDFVEVQGLCVGGRKESEVIRELVRRALYAKRYRQATTDPAFREILRGFDDQVGVRLHLLEERINKRLDADLNLLLVLVEHLCIASAFMLSELRPVRFSVTPDEVTEEEFLAGWNERFENRRAAVAEEIRQRLARRKQQIAASQDGDRKGDAGGGE